jgi:23S rRNA (guanosine2251-2'-O)-methyltransferase
MDQRVVSGRRPVLELLRAETPIDRLLVGERGGNARTIAEVRKRASQAGVPVRSVPRAELDRLTGGANHQGVVALTRRYRYTPMDSFLAEVKVGILFLDGVMDPHNLGSLLRSAHGAAFSGVIIPARRAAGITAAVERVAAGAADLIPVARVNRLAAALDDARAAGLWTIGLDASAPREIWDPDLPSPPVGLVLGAEDRGLSAGTRDRCDVFARIPIWGRLDSLNVAVAGAIAMFEVARRATALGTL